MRIAATVQYVGEHFYGFQRQKQFRTVQGELENAFSTYLREKIEVFPAGRTDTGVHAEGQVLHFDCQASPAIDEMIYAVNAILPKDCSISYAQQVADNFHARFSCQSRIYSYCIYNSPRRNALYEKTSIWIRKPIDDSFIERLLNDCATGELDFRTFTRAKLVKRGEPTHRRLEKFKMFRYGDLLILLIKGSGFLHNMVRILVGSALESSWQPDAKAHFLEVMQSGDRRLAGQTLPAHALTFLNAKYAEYQTPIRYLTTYNQLSLTEEAW